MSVSKKYYILKYGKKDNLWYVDVRGLDETGYEVWLSGNSLEQEQFGFGGFHTYKQCKQIVDNFNPEIITDPNILRYSSEGVVASFTPKKLYIGYAPSKGDNYQLWLEKELD